MTVMNVVSETTTSHAQSENNCILVQKVTAISNSHQQLKYCSFYL